MDKKNEIHSNLSQYQYFPLQHSTLSLCSSIMVPVLWTDSDCFAVGLNAFWIIYK